MVRLPWVFADSRAKPLAVVAVCLLPIHAIAATPAGVSEEDDLEVVARSKGVTATVGATLEKPAIEAPELGQDERERHELGEKALESAVASGPSPSGLGGLLQGLRVSGYLQVQYEASEQSEDQLLQGGQVLNRNRFLVRRGRIRFDGDWRFVEAALEFDGSTTRGPFFGVRRATLAAKWPGDSGEDVDALPVARATVGLTEIPFGYELRLGQRELWFMERTTGSLAFFPGPVDLGVRVDGALGAFRYDLAVMNGAPLDDRAGAVSQDPTSMPDFAGRLGLEIRPFDALELCAGTSFLFGSGFHPGSDATKNRIEWRDLNEDGTLGLSETVGVPGSAALPSATFRRWGFGADVALALRTRLGLTKVLGEVTLSSNLDRGLFVADPVAAGVDIRQVAAYAALIQVLREWAVVGVRYDFYDPNSDLLEQRRGKTVPADASLHTLSPIAGAVLPKDVLDGVRGRLVLQYDVVFDALGRDPSGVPADLANDQLTVRLQGEF